MTQMTQPNCEPQHQPNYKAAANLYIGTLFLGFLPALFVGCLHKLAHYDAMIIRHAERTALLSIGFLSVLMLSELVLTGSAKWMIAVLATVFYVTICIGQYHKVKRYAK